MAVARRRQEGTSRRTPKTRDARVERKSLAYPDASLLALFEATPAAAGVSVTPRTAVKVPAVRCAVQTIAEAVGQLPIHIHRRNDGGSKERDNDHPAYALLNDAANEWTPSSTFREEITRDALLQPGGGFAFINRVGDGKPFELIRLDPDVSKVTVERGAGGEPIYKVREGGQDREIDRRNIFHIPSPSLTGRGLVHEGREAIALAIVLERHAAHLFGRGARPSGLLSFKGNPGNTSLENAKAMFQAMHGGENAGGTAVVGAEAEWRPLTFNSVDAQFLEIWNRSVIDIARLFRVPPHMLYELGRATWSNAEEMGQQFLTHTLMPWLLRWTGEIALKLFTPDERKVYQAEFLTDALVRADLAARMEAYTKAIAARILNPNEARAMENRPPYEGGDKFENPNTSTGQA